VPRWFSAWWRTLGAPQLFVGSFAVLIAAGTLALRLLPGLYVGERLGWLDALFTATSAVCVTGLIVEDTATFFTPLGQGVILALIQLGGIGMLTLTSLVILALGRRLSLRQETVMAGYADVVPEVGVRHLLPAIVAFTLGSEAVGAALLYASWGPALGWGWEGAGWHAVFHAVSAFCNAGFSTFSDSLMGFQRDGPILAVVMVLVVLGGIGFLTLEEAVVWRQAVRARRRFRLSLHSRLALVTTAVLLAVGWVGFTAFEWGVELADLAPGEKVLNGLFASVTARTAGFNTIDYGNATASTNFLTILLMFVGGSPGSTAGGIKTTTLALLVLLAWCRLRGRTVVAAHGRSVPEETVQRAVGLFVVATLFLIMGVFAFTTTEIGRVAHPEAAAAFLPLLFEVVSAFNTVGLSMGPTGDLSPAGRAVTVFLMFVGRVGPLTFAAALALRRRPERGFRFSHEEVIVG